MDSHPLGSKAPIQEEHDACEERHLFKRDMMFVKGGTYSGNGVTIRKGCLDPYIKPLIFSLKTTQEVLENRGNVREYRKC